MSRSRLKEAKSRKISKDDDAKWFPEICMRINGVSVSFEDGIQSAFYRREQARENVQSLACQHYIDRGSLSVKI